MGDKIKMAEENKENVPLNMDEIMKLLIPNSE